jgi:broad specificity phosphatase PhoE
MLTLLLLRHASVSWNREGRCAGHTDLALDDVGATQAELTARFLSKHRFSAIYSSPLRRCRDTAECVAKYQRACPRIDEALIELNYGGWEGKLFDDLLRGASGYAEWIRDPRTTKPPGGESIQSAVSRASSLLRTLKSEHSASSVLLIGHKTFFSILVAHVLNPTDITLFQRLELANCGITTLQFHTNSSFILEAWNETAHLLTALAKG